MSPPAPPNPPACTMSKAESPEDCKRQLGPKEIADAYARYGPYILQRCRRILGSEAAAQDALQETFMRVWRRPHLFASAESKLAWLYRVAENCSFDQLSRATTRSTLPRDYRALSKPSEHHYASPAEDRDVAMKFLAVLDDKHRRVALLHYVDEMGQEEIARTVGCSRQTVVNRLTAIKQRMAAFRTQDEGGVKALADSSPRPGGGLEGALGAPK